MASLTLESVALGRIPRVPCCPTSRAPTAPSNLRLGASREFYSRAAEPSYLGPSAATRRPLGPICLSVSTDVSTNARSAGEGASGRETPSSLNVVVTGSTKGVGLALAREFLRAGDRVVVTSRSEDRVGEALDSLQAEFGESRVFGTVCDVSDAESVAGLAAFATASLGRVDVWINNAGTNAYYYGPIVECEAEALREIVGTNLLGLMLCCRQAILLMKAQPSGGHIFNMDGAGADGSATPRFAAYGATKRSLAQLTKSLQAEMKLIGASNVTVHNLSPGMVTTELLMSGANTPTAKFFINALAEPAEDVASFLVPRVRDVASSPAASPSYIKFLTRPKALSQIFQRLVFQARKGRYVPEDD